MHSIDLRKRIPILFVVLAVVGLATWYFIGGGRAASAP